MFRCVLQSIYGTYYCYNEEPNIDLQKALCFETRLDAEWERDENSYFKEGRIIPVNLTEAGIIMPFPIQYMVVSYKPDHVDYCRGCVMGSYDSKHTMTVLTTEEEVVEHIAQLDAVLNSLDTEYQHWIMSIDDIFGGNFNPSSWGNIGLQSNLMQDKIKQRVEQLQKQKLLMRRSKMT